ncbi:two-component regulator propeller domain-containing protein [Massilia sp. YIM B02763]|uniref:sensor histidine kinase n=1 Tax=Massilia sp. YIM B02763 TaxID=3050130 RepID=UPI0025B67C80|nr:two-component regulator propeller domain-containing protein [Massilia sp. YIM B02763]MDN4056429.1 two-component regulator propeller domain-containing protein [Massilia sp. YIM B02763]
MHHQHPFSRRCPPAWQRPLRMALAGLLLLCSCQAALAGGPRSLRFEHVGLEEGLSQESVLTILQDRDGFMWFGSQAGLNRFDGYRIRVFRNDPNDPGSLADNFVGASHEDAQGRLWFGTRGGLVRFDKASQRFARYPLSRRNDGLARNSAVNAIVGDGKGGLWVGTGDGLVHLDPDSGRFRSLQREAGIAGTLSDERVNALAVDGRGGLWVGTGVGIDYLAPGAVRFDHFDVGPRRDSKRNSVAALSIDAQDTLWIGTGSGLEAWHLGDGPPRRERVDMGAGTDDVRVRSLYHDSGNNLWVGTNLDGLKWRDPSSGRFIAYASQPLDRHALSDNQVSAIWVDRTGTLWVGTMFGGVNRADLASGGFHRFSYVPVKGRDGGARKVRAIAPGPGGGLWLGTVGGGILHLDPASGRVVAVRNDPRDPSSLPDDLVTTLLRGRGRLWVGSPSGLSWRDDATGRFTTVRLGTDAAGNYVQRLAASRDGNVWAVTHGGLFMLAPDGRVAGAWRHDPADPSSLGENYGYAALEDRQGAIWVGTENGLDRLDRQTGKFTHFRRDPRVSGGLVHNRIADLYESARGDVWVGTAGGLARVERGPGGQVSFKLFPVTAGREQVPIGAILEDAHGSIWASTTAGISRVDPDTGRFKAYGAKDGLLDGTYFIGSALRGADGDLHFGGGNGMTSFAPDAIRDNPYAPVVVITDFWVFNRPRTLATSPGKANAVELGYRDSVFTLEFAALHYADPQSNRYAYRLRGFDQDWTETDAGKRFATYTNLDPGTYLFEVRAANKDGVWSEKPARLAITITPPYWRTWWFRFLATAVVLGGAAFVYRLRVRVLVRQTERLERQVGARTAELVLQKDRAERRKQEAEAQKEAVEQARRNIALLSEIGRELTANLDSEAIMANVYGQVRRLMDARLFAIGVARTSGRLDYPYIVEDGCRAEDEHAWPDAVRRLGEQCLASGEEIIIGDMAQEAPGHIDADGAGAHAPGQVPRSLLFVPIAVGTRVLGVISVQSWRAWAYQNVQLDMLSTLASYVGVALDNADAYRQLKETQAQLAAHEKLASLGSLVAGVAHELNTPIGNSLLMASTLQEKTEDLSARFAANNLKKSDLEAWIGAAREASALIQRSLQSAADLVNSFKQVSVDQASTQRRRFDLAQACHEIAATMMNQVRRAGHALELDVPAGIAMDSYPGPFGQVAINFINNALLHAFDAPGGRMVLSASMLDAERVRVVFRDDGRGIAPEHLGRIFDPFFTTRMGQGGTGLGLNIAYTIVTTLLGGTIRVDSEPGQGTAFVLDLPLRPADARALGGVQPDHEAA